MSTPALQPGMTCHLGKGKTKWEVIKVNAAAHTVDLSALGKGGYSNRHANIDELSRVEDQVITTRLGQVIEARAKARAAAANLNDRLRFSETRTIREATRAANDSAYTYVGLVEDHNGDLAALGIKAD